MSACEKYLELLAESLAKDNVDIEDRTSFHEAVSLAFTSLPRTVDFKDDLLTNMSDKVDAVWNRIHDIYIVGHFKVGTQLPEVMLTTNALEQSDYEKYLESALFSTGLASNPKTTMVQTVFSKYIEKNQIKSSANNKKSILQLSHALAMNNQNNNVVFIRASSYMMSKTYEAASKKKKSSKDRLDCAEYIDIISEMVYFLSVSVYKGWILPKKLACEVAQMVTNTFNLLVMMLNDDSNQAFDSKLYGLMSSLATLNLQLLGTYPRHIVRVLIDIDLSSINKKCLKEKLSGIYSKAVAYSLDRATKQDERQFVDMYLLIAFQRATVYGLHFESEQVMKVRDYSAVDSIAQLVPHDRKIFQGLENGIDVKNGILNKVRKMVDIEHLIDNVKMLDTEFRDFYSEKETIATTTCVDDTPCSLEDETCDFKSNLSGLIQEIKDGEGKSETKRNLTAAAKGGSRKKAKTCQG